MESLENGRDMRKEREKRLLLSGTMILLFPFIALGEKRGIGQNEKQTKKKRESTPAGSEAKDE